MTELNQVYRCTICGNVIEVVNAGSGELHCCGKPMALMTENSVDAAKEKHVPVVEKVEGGYKVCVGSVEHPMYPEHYIQWIELMTDGKVIRRWLAPGEKPEAVFVVDSDKVKVREYCNLHGLWVAE